MALYAISDLHLSLSCDKSMTVFKGWENYVERIRANWTRLVKSCDTVVIPGDISWSLKLEDTIEDFKFLESLNGRKIIIKGNHDLWWPTITKLNDFFQKNEIKTISTIFNNAIVSENLAVCGTRGWSAEENGQKDRKVILREAGRLSVSLHEAEKTGLEPVVFLHYPPAYEGYCCDEIIDVLKKYNIKEVYHGHIHGAGYHRSIKEIDGIKLKLVSCDCIDFTPYPITPKNS